MTASWDFVQHDCPFTHRVTAGSLTAREGHESAYTCVACLGEVASDMLMRWPEVEVHPVPSQVPFPRP